MASFSIKLLTNNLDGLSFIIDTKIAPSKWIDMTFTTNIFAQGDECPISPIDKEGTIANLKMTIDGNPAYTGSYITTVSPADTLTVEGVVATVPFTIDTNTLGINADIQIIENSVSPEPDITPTIPYFSLPELNSIDFKLVQEYNNRNIYQNSFNSKAVQSDENVVDCTEQIFHWEDSVISQFRSNYETLLSTQTDEDDNVLALDIELKIENLDQKTSMDGKMIDMNATHPNKTGVYFESGNIYAYDTTTPPIDTYELNGKLPEWGVKDNYLYSELVGTWFQVEEVIYEPSISANVLVIDLVYPAITDSVVMSKYNRFNYNVYEFIFNPYDKVGKKPNLQLTNTDARDGFIDLSYSSENVSVEYQSDKNIELVYFNYENTSSVYFSTGFYGILRLPYILFTEGIDNEIKTDKLSNTVISQSSSNLHTKTLSLERVPTMMERKITEAFTCKEVFLNRIQYTVKSVESEWVASTNAYSIEIELYDAEIGFNPLQDRKYCGDRLVAPNEEGAIEGEIEYEL